MVAADHRCDIGFSPIDHLVGLSAVPHQIAQAEDPVVTSAGVCEYGLEIIVITVNVAKD